MALAFACGSESQQEEDRELLADDGPVPAESFLRALAVSVCNATEVCEPDPYIRRWQQEGTCVAAMERRFNVDLGGRIASVRFGELSYDGAAARACLQSFAGKCPPAFRLLTNPLQPDLWCPEAFDGCPMPYKEHWVSPLPQGAHCLPSIEDPCAVGLRCSFASSTCEPCAGQVSDDACEESSEAHEALEELYLVDRPEGSSCDGPEGFSATCNVGLRCLIATLECTALRRAGEPCPNGEECAGRCNASCEPACLGPR